MQRRQLLIGLALATPIIGWGCDNSVNKPQDLTIAGDLPVTATCKVNGTLLKGPETAIHSLPSTAIFVSGELKAIPNVRLARYPQPYIVTTGLVIPPIPRPKNWTEGFVDQPEDIHVILFLSLSYSGRDRTKEEHAGTGFINQLVDVDRKKAEFSGAVVSPQKSGTYALRIWGSFKPEKECTSAKDRGAVGVLKLLQEVTLNVEPSAESP